MLAALALAVWSLGGAAQAQEVPPSARTAQQDLFDAAKLGIVAAVKNVLPRAPSVDVEDTRGFTALHWASAGGYADLVRLLIEAGANVNHRARDGTTPLMLAAGNGFDDVVRALIAAGASTTAARGGDTVRELAQRRNHTAVLARLDQVDELARRLQQAVAEGHDSLVRQLVAQGAPADQPDAQGVTPLMTAARNGDLGIMQHLVSRGANLAARDRDGRTVIDWAGRAPLTAPYVLSFVRDRLPAAVDAPTPPSVLVVPSVATSLRALADTLSKVPVTNAAVRRVHRSTTATLERLLSLSAGWPAESPEDYRLSLATLVTQLEATIARGDQKLIADTLQSLGEDLEAKLEHCVQSGGALGGSVTVSVRTLRAGTEITSWQVFYIPKMLEASANASPDLFPQLSSPSQERLVPGRYVMWVRDPGSARVGERTVVKIGEGRKELVVELPVPVVDR